MIVDGVVGVVKTCVDIEWTIAWYCHPFWPHYQVFWSFLVRAFFFWLAYIQKRVLMADKKEGKVGAFTKMWSNNLCRQAQQAPLYWIELAMRKSKSNPEVLTKNRSNKGVRLTADVISRIRKNLHSKSISDKNNRRKIKAPNWSTLNRAPRFENNRHGLFVRGRRLLSRWFSRQNAEQKGKFHWQKY